MIKSLIFFLVFYLSSSNLFSKEISFKGFNKLSINDLENIISLDLSKKNPSIEDLNLIIKELYNSDLIYNVELIENANEYIILIEENKIIENIYINNNIWIEDSLILDNILSKKNTLFSKVNLISDINLINSLYKTKGFYEVSTVAKFESFSEDRVNLIFEIYEGNQSKLDLILFKGNNSYADKYLSSRITSKSNNFYNLFSSGSNLNSEIFKFDKNSLKSFYYDNGFFDTKISYNIEKNNFGAYSLIFFIEEGTRYKINQINFDSDLDKLSLFTELYSKFESDLNKNNNYYSKQIIYSFLEDINFHLIDNNINNYFIDIDLNTENDFINLDFIKKNQEPKTINKINIHGNTITKDKTIRSKLLIEPGNVYNKFLIEKSKENLVSFTYIKDVEVTTDVKTNVDLDIDIKENKKTGNVLLAGTFNTDTQFGLTFGVEDKNFLGSGNILDANFDINSENLKFDINYTHYPISNPFLSNTYSIFNQENDLSDSFGYELSKQGIAYKMNFSQNDLNKYGLGFRIDKSKGHNPKDSTVSAISDNIGTFTNFSISFDFNRDSTNDLFNPTNGFKNSLSFTIAPADISDDPFYKIILTNKNYFNYKNSDNYIFLNNNIGYAKSLNSKLKTINAFSLGGNNFKGFDYRGIGPKNGNIYLGGNQFFTSTIGYGSSFIFDKKDNVNIKLFSSIGSLWNSDYSNADFELRSSAGISLDFITAIGPISFSYAIPIQKFENDSVREFSFAIGSSF